MAHDDPFAGKTTNADWAYYLDTAGTYTPALTATTTNPNLGADGVINGWWHRNGHQITTGGGLNFSGAGLDPGSGVILIELPFSYDASIYPTTNFRAVVGTAYLFDASSQATRHVAAVALRLESADRISFRLDGETQATDASPFIWADDDQLSWFATYLADPAGLPT